MITDKRKLVAKKLVSVFVSVALLITVFPTSIIVNAEVNSSVQSTTWSSGNTLFTLSNDTLQIRTSSDVIDLEACSSEILKVNYKPNGQESEDTLVLDPDRKWENGDIISYDLQSNPAIIQTSKMIVKISKDDLSISVYDTSNGFLVKQATLPKNNQFTLNHNSGQNFYGISAQGNTTYSDSTLRTGSNKVESGSQGHAGGPFTWTTSGYGILVDSDGGYINLGDTSLTYSNISKVDTEYYILVGNPTEILQAQAKVSGTSPMFPKWATGFTNTQWGWYKGSTAEEQLKNVINTYRAKEIPIDNFCLDFDWKLWGTGDAYGEFRWNHYNFPSASSGELKKYMDDRGVKLTGIVKPRLFLGTQEANDMYANDWWHKYSGTINDYCANKPVKQVDFSNPDLRNWWWAHTQEAFDLGLVGFWNDECDIENGFGNFDNLNMQRAIYEGQTAYTSEQRVWSINRNYYTGAQRYAYGLWSGDIGSGFGVMKLQKERLIAAINLGEAKWGMDTGGFNGDPSNENYARWIQFSAFTPIFRVHGQNINAGHKVRYPWAYGEKAEAAAKSVMQLRYKLIPYIYKYDNQAYENGVGLVKSLMMEYPNDPNTKTYTDAWMFGDYLLVSPVLDQGQTKKSIYLPEGTWIDYFKGTTYKGGQTITYDVDSVNWSDVPLFIKQGAIIPTQDYENYVGEKKMTNIYVDCFPNSEESTFDYYDDDGNSTSYKDGNYFKQTFELSRNDYWTAQKFTTSAKEGTYKPDVEYYIVKMHLKSTGLPTIDGETPTKYNDFESLKNAQGEGYAIGTDIYGDVAYVKIEAGKVKTVEVSCEFDEGEEKTINIYGRSTDNTGKFQYSIDGGKTWSDEKSMTQASDAIGYLKISTPYRMSSNIPIKVRYCDSEGYKPSSEGVQLPNKNDNIFTVEKDGTVSVGKPAIKTTNLYIEGDTSNLLLQYKCENGNWSEKVSLSPYLDMAGRFYYSLSYPLDIKSSVVRYSLDNGETWLPSEEGQSIASGDYKTDSAGKFVSGKPVWDNIVTIYYNCKNGYSTPYIHWRPAGGTWTTAPGVMMSDCEYDGYKKAILNIGNATEAEVCFNNGSGVWDNNGGKNYKFSKGVKTFDKGNITSGSPEGEKIITISANIQGGTYTSEQTITLTPSLSNAEIYYTLDGTTPTTSSTRYTNSIKISSTTTLKAIAVEGDTISSVYEQKYIIVDPSEVSKIYFQKPSGWGSSINVYIYNEESGSTKKVASWPGVSMTNEGNGLYSYALSNWNENAYVIFNDGSKQVPGASQQGFLLKNGESKIYKDGAWSDYNIVKEPKVLSSVEDCEFTDSLTLTLSAENCTEATYQIDNNDSVSYANGTKITIGENAEGGDKITVKLTGTDGNKTVNKTYTYTKKIVIKEPKVSSLIESCEFTDSLTLTLLAEDCIQATYQIDDDIAVEYKNGTKITIGKNAEEGAKITLKLTGTNGIDTVNKTYIYTKKVTPVIKDSKIYFQKPLGWGTSIKAYIYNEENGNVKMLSSWPGVVMTNEGDGLYSYTLKNWEENAYVIFTDGSRQTPGSGQKGFLLKNGETKIYKDSTWFDYIKVPTVSSSKENCEFIDSLTLTLSCDNCLSATYQIDDNEPVSYNDGTKIVIGENAKIGDTITIKLTGTDGENTVNKTYTYVKKDKPVIKESKIYFQKPSGWGSSMKVYIYNEENGSVKILSSWPGVAMTDEGNGLYSYTLENWEEDAYVIFTDGSRQTPGSGQTGFLLKNGESKIYKDGVWSSYTE